MIELTWLALPSRVYTQTHLDMVVRALCAVQLRKEELTGYHITKERKILQYLTAKSTPII